MSFFKPQISPGTPTGDLDFGIPFGESEENTRSEEDSLGNSTHSSRLRQRGLKKAGREFTHTRNVPLYRPLLCFQVNMNVC